MPISFPCKCGRPLQAPNDQAGKRVQCPACGRAMMVPTPALDKKSPSGWEINVVSETDKRAEQAGVVRQGRANVLLLHSTGTLHQHLAVSGIMNCWNCKTAISFTGKVFGRPGLGGELTTVTCTRCKARMWTGFSSHVTGEGTDIYLYAPSPTRKYTKREDEALPAPSFRVEQVKPDAGDHEPEGDSVKGILAQLTKAISGKASFQEVQTRASQLVGQLLGPAQFDSVCRALRTILVQEDRTFIKAIVAEALASFRDESAAPVVQNELRSTLEQEDASDPGNMPLHDFCVIGLLFGDGNDFLDAMEAGTKELTITTRALRVGQALSIKEVYELIYEGNQIDSFESALGGPAFQRIHPLLPLWVDEEKLKKDETRKGWLGKLFKSKGKK